MTKEKSVTKRLMLIARANFFHYTSQTRDTALGHTHKRVIGISGLLVLYSLCVMLLKASMAGTLPDVMALISQFPPVLGALCTVIVMFAYFTTGTIAWGVATGLLGYIFSPEETFLGY
ncbi:hypothetical protein ACFLZC_02160 [Patescibacteria group bacterium]